MFLKRLSDFLKLFRFRAGGWKAFLRPEYDRLAPLLKRAAGCYRKFFIPKCCVVAVVGSLGKTTTTRALNAVLQIPDRGHSHSNYGSSIAANLLRTRPGDSHAVLEVGVKGPGQMASCARMLRPDIVVVTAIASDHNRSFPTLEDTRREKVRMLTDLSSTSYAVLNGDDPHVRWMASQTRATVRTFGFNPENDLRAADIRMDSPKGTRFKLHAGDESREALIPLLGKHMVYPALAAATVGILRGLTLDEITARLEKIKPANARLQWVELPNGAKILDDSHKASLESVYAAIEIFLQIPAKRRILVLGSIEEPPGQQGPIYRELGTWIGKRVDRIIGIGGDPLARLIGASVRAGMDKSCCTFVGSSFYHAVNILKSELSEGDTVLVKGSSAQQLRRIRIALSGRDVRCRVKYCSVKVDSCDVCPLVGEEEGVFHNYFISRSVRM